MTQVEELYLDPFYVEIDADPYDIWRDLRDHAPEYRNERFDFWALSRYDDVEAAHRDPATFSSAHGTVLEIMTEETVPSGMMISSGLRRPSLSGMSSPTRQRKQ